MHLRNLKSPILRRMGLEYLPTHLMLKIVVWYRIGISFSRIWFSGTMLVFRGVYYIGISAHLGMTTSDLSQQRFSGTSRSSPFIWWKRPRNLVICAALLSIKASQEMVRFLGQFLGHKRCALEASMLEVGAPLFPFNHGEISMYFRPFIEVINRFITSRGPLCICLEDWIYSYIKSK